MVDSFNTTEPVSSEDPLAAAPKKSGIAGFAASTTGKLVIGGAAVVALLSILGVVLFSFVFSQVDPDLVVVAPGSAVTTETVGSAEETVVVPPARATRDTFTFRNILRPTVKPVVVVEPSAAATTTADGAAPGSSGASLTVDPGDVPNETLYLYAVTTVDGVEYGTFIWNQTVYVFPEGEELPGTPWKVLRIDGNSAVMLYGDSQVTISVGQGMTK